MFRSLRVHCWTLEVGRCLHAPRAGNTSLSKITIYRHQGSLLNSRTQAQRRRSIRLVQNGETLTVERRTTGDCASHTRRRSLASLSVAHRANDVASTTVRWEKLQGSSPLSHCRQRARRRPLFGCDEVMPCGQPVFRREVWLIIARRDSCMRLQLGNRWKERPREQQHDLRTSRER